MTTEEKSSQRRYLYYLIPCILWLASLLAVHQIALKSLSNRNPNDVEMIIKFGKYETKTKINVHKTETDSSYLMDKIFSKQNSKYYMPWIKDKMIKENIFKRYELSELIEKAVPSILSSNDVKLIVNRIDPDSKLFQINDSELVEELMNKCAETLTIEEFSACLVKDKTANKLVKYCKNDDKLFRHAGDNRRIGIPAEKDQPPKTYAFALKELELFQHTIEVYSIDRQDKITVQVNGEYPREANQVADIHLNSSDALRIFGDTKVKDSVYVVDLGRCQKCP